MNSQWLSEKGKLITVQLGGNKTQNFLSQP